MKKKTEEKVTLTELELDVIATAVSMSRMCSNILHGSEMQKFHNNSYGFISSAIGMIDYALIAIKTNFGDDKSIKIVDLGCGVSPLLIALRTLGYKNLVGVDFNATNLSYLTSSLPCTPSMRLLCKGIEKVTKQELSSTSFVYSYMPIANKEQYKKVMKSVWKKLPVGCIHLETLGPLEQALSGDKNVERLSGNYPLFRKIKAVK